MDMPVVRETQPAGTLLVLPVQQNETMRITPGTLATILVIWAATAGSLLGNGTALHNHAFIIIGAAMSLICPGGVVIAWIASRIRR